MKNDSLIFSQTISFVKTESSNDAIIDLNVFKFSKKIGILPRRRPNSNEQSFFIHSVSAESFDLLVKQQKVQIFAMFIKNIDQQLQFDVKS